MMSLFKITRDGGFAAAKSHSFLLKVGQQRHYHAPKTFRDASQTLSSPYLQLLTKAHHSSTIPALGNMMWVRRHHNTTQEQKTAKNVLESLRRVQPIPVRSEFTSPRPLTSQDLQDIHVELGKHHTPSEFRLAFIHSLCLKLLFCRDSVGPHRLQSCEILALFCRLIFS
jgi:hypothetical protein